MSERTVIPYHELPGFDCVYLEDSYVTGLTEDPTSLELSLDLVLTECHPLYRPPGPDEQYWGIVDIVSELPSPSVEPGEGGTRMTAG